MYYNRETHHRKSIRLNGYNYSQKGLYFITICTQNREHLFGEIGNKKMIFNDAGTMVLSAWNQLPTRFDNIILDEYIIMPNHIHGIIVINPDTSKHIRRGESCIRPYTAPDIRPNKNTNVYPDITPNIYPNPNIDPTDNIHSINNHDIKQTDNNYMDYNHSDTGHTGTVHTEGEYKIRPCGTLPGSLGRIIQAFKSITTHEYTINVKQNGWTHFPRKLWQRNYWDQIVRNEQALNYIRNYIQNNPAKWQMDKLNGGRGNIVMKSSPPYGKKI